VTILQTALNFLLLYDTILDPGHPTAPCSCRC